MGDRDLAHLEATFKRKIEAWIPECKAAGYTVLVTDGYRSFAEQDALYAQGRTTEGPKVTNAKAGDSYHNVRRAVDYCILVHGRASYDGAALKATAKLAEGHGIEWGGRWPTFHDDDHLQWAYCEQHEERHSGAHAFDETGNCRA